VNGPLQDHRSQASHECPIPETRQDWLGFGEALKVSQQREYYWLLPEEAEVAAQCPRLPR
jgi:hypothetical protein